ncbi:MAG: CoA-binding protein [Promethearchaeota archaeon]
MHNSNSKSNSNILDLFFNPKSLAIIGASKNPTKGGHRIINNLTLNNYKGKIYPINPNYDTQDEVFGFKFNKSILDIEEKVDLVIFYVGNRLIPGLLKQCIDKGIKAALIQASGFSEVGDKGIILKEEIVKITDNFSKIRIVGPNCMGLSRFDGDYNSDERGGFCSGFGTMTDYRTGNIAVITQSGMLNGGFLLGLFTRYPDLGIRYSCSIGNKMDLGENEFLEYMLNDPTVNVITLYLESFKDPRKFISLCNKAKSLQNKSIVLLKGGITSQGRQASKSHTGSLAENSLLTDAVIKQSGILRAYSFQDLFQYSRTLSMMYKTGKKMPKKGHISIMGGSGGAGTVCSDLSMKYGLLLPKLDNETYQQLKELYPTWMPPNRFALLDLWPTFEKAMMKGISRDDIMNKIFDVIFSDSNIEGVLYSMFCSSSFGGRRDIDEMINKMSKFPKPIFCWLLGDGQQIIQVSEKMCKLNIPNFTSMEESIKNFSILVQESKNRENMHKNY